MSKLTRQQEILLDIEYQKGILEEATDEKQSLEDLIYRQNIHMSILDDDIKHAKSEIKKFEVCLAQLDE